VSLVVTPYDADEDCPRGGVVIERSDGEGEPLVICNGEQGPKGDQGEQGPEGAAGAPGPGQQQQQQQQQPWWA
jgi:hypothetical protein